MKDRKGHTSLLTEWGLKIFDLWTLKGNQPIIKENSYKKKKKNFGPPQTKPCPCKYAWLTFTSQPYQNLCSCFRSTDKTTVVFNCDSFSKATWTLTQSFKTCVSLDRIGENLGSIWLNQILMMRPFGQKRCISKLIWITNLDNLTKHESRLECSIPGPSSLIYEVNIKTV